MGLSSGIWVGIFSLVFVVHWGWSELHYNSCVDESQQCAYNGKDRCKRNLYFGSKSTTVEGFECQRWDRQTPHSHDQPELTHNYCRNPDGENGPWCYTTNEDIRWQYCFPTCNDCVDYSRGCAYNGRSKCKQNKNYGTKSITIAGLQCQRWDKQTPHSHSQPSAAHNFCRNPDGEDGPWCYTTDEDIRWQYCFPTCTGHYNDDDDDDDDNDCVDNSRECAYNGNRKCKADEDFGTKSRTIDGIRCQRWDRQSPHTHRQPAERHNYCRNPDGEDGPWCYTTDEDIRWQYCYPTCRGGDHDDDDSEEPKYRWVSGGRSRCGRVCARWDMLPYPSGAYTNGNNYFVCAGNAQGEGYRAGFNLRPSWSNGCTVGYGGGVIEQGNQKCLCVEDYNDVDWVDSDSSESCEDTCEYVGKKPVISGEYDRSGQPFHVCSTNYRSEGYRPGYQIPDFARNKCIVAYDDDEVQSTSKRCLCY